MYPHGPRRGLTETVLGANVEITALHSITVAVGAGPGAGGAGGEVPGDPCDGAHSKLLPHIAYPITVWLSGSPGQPCLSLGMEDEGTSRMTLYTPEE